MLARLYLEVLDVAIGWQTDETAEQLAAAIASGAFGPATVVALDSPERPTSSGCWRFEAVDTVRLCRVAARILATAERRPQGTWNGGHRKRKGALTA